MTNEKEWIEAARKAFPTPSHVGIDARPFRLVQDANDLRSSLAAANQQLDAMRAELAYRDTNLHNQVQQIQRLEREAELAALRQSTEADCSEHHRLAHESLQREYIALEADRDTWKKNAEMANVQAEPATFG